MRQVGLHSEFQAWLFCRVRRPCLKEAEEGVEEKGENEEEGKEGEERKEKKEGRKEKEGWVLSYSKYSIMWLPCYTHLFRDHGNTEAHTSENVVGVFA